MTAEEFVTGLRERGYFVMRMREGPTTLIPILKPNDPLYRWLQDELGVQMTPFRLSAEVPIAYEARLNTARVEGGPVGVWEAAA